jgi:hypothetical protein
MVGWDFDGDVAAEELEENAFAVVFGLAVVDCEVSVEGTDDDLDGLAALDCAFWEADESVACFAATDSSDNLVIEVSGLVAGHEDS